MFTLEVKVSALDKYIFTGKVCLYEIKVSILDSNLYIGKKIFTPHKRPYTG